MERYYSVYDFSQSNGNSSNSESVSIKMGLKNPEYVQKNDIIDGGGGDDHDHDHEDDSDIIPDEEESYEIEVIIFASIFVIASLWLICTCLANKRK